MLSPADIWKFLKQELGAGIRATIQDVVAKAKAKVNTTQTPKLAPQFDGLDSFETLVGR